MPLKNYLAFCSSSIQITQTDDLHFLMFFFILKISIWFQKLDIIIFLPPPLCIKNFNLLFSVCNFWNRYSFKFYNVWFVKLTCFFKKWQIIIFCQFCVLIFFRIQNVYVSFNISLAFSNSSIQITPTDDLHLISKIAFYNIFFLISV